MRLKKVISWSTRIALILVLCLGLFTGCSCDLSGVDGLTEMETKNNEPKESDYDRNERYIEALSKYLGGFIGNFRPQMSEEQKAQLVNPEAAILQISITPEAKLQVVDPVIEMDTSKPMNTYEDIQNAKGVIKRTETKVYDFSSPTTVDGRQVLNITGEDGSTGTITILSDDKISVSFGNGSMTYERV